MVQTMSRKYKFLNKEGLYFVSFATVNWIDVFTRPVYNEIVVDSLRWCIDNIGMELYCWVIMPNHVHLIFSAKNNNPEIVLGRFKDFTAKQLIKAIAENPQESRKEWMLSLFRQAGAKSSNVTNYQFWRHDNKPIELWSPQVIEQKADYIHNNPVKAGFVMEPQYWKYSSAIDYCGGKGLIDIEYL
jgi:putative transposase